MQFVLTPTSLELKCQHHTTFAFLNSIDANARKASIQKRPEMKVVSLLERCSTDRMSRDKEQPDGISSFFRKVISLSAALAGDPLTVLLALGFPSKEVTSSG